MPKKSEMDEVWKKIEEELRNRGTAKLICDGDEIKLRIMVHSNNWLQLAIYVFANGGFPLGRNERYCMQRQTFAYKAKARKLAQKMSKKRLKEFGFNPDEKCHYVDPRWTSFQAMRRHFENTCSSIALEEQDATK